MAPRRATSLLGFDPDSGPQLPYLARIAGARDVALAWGTLTSDGQARRRWIAAALLSDAADCAAGAIAGRSGHMSKASAVLASGSGGVAAALGAVALIAGGRG